MSKPPKAKSTKAKYTPDSRYGISVQEHRTEVIKRREKALAYRKQGMTYNEIGKKLHITKATAYMDVKKFTSIDKQEKLKEVKDLELQRLDSMLEGSYKKAIKGDTKASDMVLKIMERRSKLLNLDAPKVSKLDEHVKFIIVQINKEDPAEKISVDGPEKITKERVVNK